MKASPPDAPRLELDLDIDDGQVYPEPYGCLVREVTPGHTERDFLEGMAALKQLCDELPCTCIAEE